MLHVQKEDLCFLAGHDVADQFPAGNGGIVFPEDLTLFHMAENMAVDPVEVDYDVHAAGFDDPDLTDG